MGMQERLKDKFDYRDGKLWRKEGRYSSRPSGSLYGNGYYVSSFEGTREYNHRLIWKMLKGEIPKGYEIDHIDRDKTNNRIENLRLATRSENIANSKGRGKLPKNVHRRVYPSGRVEYSARVSKNGKLYCSYHSTLEEAKNSASEIRNLVYGGHAYADDPID